MCKNTTFIMKPKVDFCFKELMAFEAVRQGFIAAVLGVKPEEIRKTELLWTEMNRTNEKDKLGILDVRVSMEGNIQLDIEIQVAQFLLWPERSLFYLSKMYVEQIRKGEEYDVLKKCIHIGILDFVLFEKDEEFYSRFHMWEDIRRRMYSDKFEIHIIELPKLKEHEYPETTLLNWARFLNAEKEEEFKMLAKTDPYIAEAYKQLCIISADEKKRQEYEARQKAILDHNQLMKDNFNKGIELGIKALTETCQEFGNTMDETVKKIVEKFSISEQKAVQAAERYWVK